jgi:hypothetical protein
VGTVFAHDGRAYQRWANRQLRPVRTAPADDQVMGQIMALASMFPGSVEHGLMPAGG